MVRHSQTAMASLPIDMGDRTHTLEERPTFPNLPHGFQLLQRQTRLSCSFDQSHSMLRRSQKSAFSLHLKVLTTQTF